jgi:penicillin-binding protein 1A
MDGEERYREEAVEEPIVTPETAYTLVDLMKGVVKRGTARAAAKMPYYLAGKTGTTDDFRDAWFIGFSPNLLCAVWVGYDKKTNLGAKKRRYNGAAHLDRVHVEGASLLPQHGFSAAHGGPAPTITRTRE